MPPFLVGLAIVFWGWQTGFWLMSIPLALAVEAGHWNRTPWVLEESDFRRIANLCSGLLIIVLGHIVLAKLWLQSLYQFLLWLPLVFAPLILAQVHSAQGRVPLKALLALVGNDPSLQRKSFDLRYPYFAICLLSASAVVDMEHQVLPYYLGMVLLVGISLLSQTQRQNRRWPIAFSILCFLAAAIVGFGAQEGLYRFHVAFENQVDQWFRDSVQNLDPTERDTAIGQVGSLKLSNDILFRVSGKNVPPLLRQATYNRYRSGTWVAMQSEFFPVSTDATATRWDLRPNAQQFRSGLGGNSGGKFNGKFNGKLETIEIHDRLPEKKGLLKLPQSVQGVEHFPASAMERNAYGTVRVESEAPDIAYQVAFLPEQDPAATLDQPPLPLDLEVPILETPALMQILTQLNLLSYGTGSYGDGMVAAEKITHFFQDQFRYSLDLIHPRNRGAALQEFLLEKRSGHCEYFATAMTLLLRQLGIPARYAVGFSVHEFSPLEGQYVVRGRHAHAWTIAYIHDRWISLDPTPSNWRQTEAESIAPWQKVGDWVAWFQFASVQGFQTLQKSQILQRWWWVVIPFGLLYIRQLNQRRRVVAQRSSVAPTPIAQTDRRGENLSFYAIVDRLQGKGWLREPAETLKQWIDRLQQDFPNEEDWPQLRSALEQHYRDRFDPTKDSPPG